MKRFMSALVALCMLYTGQVLAEEATRSTVHPIGIVSEDTKVVLIAGKWSVLFGKFKAGDICTLHAGDGVTILDSVGGKQVVQRNNIFKVKVPSKESCPVGAAAAIDPALADAWKKTAEAVDATKAAKK